MSKRKDVTNQKFGQLLALRRLPYTQGNNAVYRCLCDCGKVVVVQMAGLTTGRRKTCGHDALARITDASFVHGLSFHPLYGYHKTASNNLSFEIDFN